MSDEQSKISIKQLIIILLIAISSPLIRVIPKNISTVAKDGSILTPLFIIIPFLILIYVLNTLINKSGEKSLQDVYIKIFGKVLGKTILFFQAIWIFILLGVYIRYFADRFASSILIFTPLYFFSSTLLVVTFIIVRNKLEYFARAIEVFSLLFSIIIGLLSLILLLYVDIHNIYPLTVFDALDSLKSTPLLFGIVSYITYMFYLGEDISNKQDFKKYTKYLTSRVVLFSLFVTLATVGIFGYKLTGQFNLPFFMFLKNIKIFNFIERFESIFLSFWFVTDFTIVALLVYILTRLIKKVTNIKYSKTTTTPIIFGAFIFSSYLVTSIFELYEFSQKFLLYINIGFQFVLPIIALIVGKLRKMV